MTGGLMNIISVGNQNIILNGNPTKTFFKTTYAKYTNFGMEKHRIDFNGNLNISSQQSTTYSFKIPRLGDLIMDTYAVITLPDIWSSFSDKLNKLPYEFKWVEYLGCVMIDNVVIKCNGGILQQFSGDYIKQSLERDLSQSKVHQFHSMIGHEDNMYDPGKAYGRKDNYPNVIYNLSEPSIKGRHLYVPLPFWYTHSTRVGFPMVCLQNADLVIDVTIKPIKSLYTILDEDGIRKSPNFGIIREQLFNFIQQRTDNYVTTLVDWKIDIHLILTYIILDTQEQNVFAKNEQTYLFKDIREKTFFNVIGTQHLDIETNNLVSSWMWYLRRNDAFERNEWTNYTNWKYKNIPNVVMEYDNDKLYTNLPELKSVNNNKLILEKTTILIDGVNREREFNADIYNYIEKYSKCNGIMDEGTYLYSFSINPSSKDLQPSGAMNLSRFKKVVIEVKTIYPEANLDAIVSTVCDNEGNIIGVLDTTQQDNYLYSFDLFFIEERYNLIKFSSGMAGLVFAR